MRRVKVVRVSDLPDTLGLSGPRPFLWCPTCYGEWSAHRGDYFAADPERVILCAEYGCSGKPLRLVVKVTRYKAWKAGKVPAREV